MKAHLQPYLNRKRGFAFSSTQNSEGKDTIEQGLTEAVTGVVPECALPAESSLRTLSP